MLLCEVQGVFGYPKTAEKPHVDHYHGVDIEDPYRWLEHSIDPLVQQWDREQQHFFKTFQQNNDQHTSVNRPWISLQIDNIDGDDNCEFILKNQGNLVAENMNITCKDRKKIKGIRFHSSNFLSFTIPRKQVLF